MKLRQQESHYIKKKITHLVAKKKYTQAIELLIDEIKYGDKPISFDGEESYTEIFFFFLPQLAYCYFKTNNFYKCRQTLNSLLEAHPNDPTALFLLAYLDLLDDNIEKAIYRYTQLLKISNAQKKTRQILNYLRKINNSTEILLRKYLIFFYEHPKLLKPPSIFNFIQWLNFKKTILKKPSSEKTTNNNTKNSFFSKKKKNLLFSFLIIPVIFIGLLVVKTIKQNKGSGSNNTIEVSLKPTIQQEVKNNTPWGIAYQTMETAIKNKDMNLAVLTYNQAILNELPRSLKKDFDILNYFIVPPTYTSLKTTTSLKKVTETIKEPTLYNGYFFKLVGTLKAKNHSLNLAEYNYIYRPKKNSLLYREIQKSSQFIEIIFSKKPIIRPNQTVEILARLLEVKKYSNKSKSIVLDGISIKSLIKK